MKTNDTTFYGLSTFPLQWATPYEVSVQFSRSVVSDSLCPMDRSTAGLPIHHQFAEFIKTHVHQVSDAIQ